MTPKLQENIIQNEKTLIALKTNQEHQAISSSDLLILSKPMLNSCQLRLNPSKEGRNWKKKGKSQKNSSLCMRFLTQNNRVENTTQSKMKSIEILKIILWKM